jgi:hypothetical protein
MVIYGVVVPLIFIALMFKGTWKLLAKLFVIFIRILKWGLIVAILWGLVNTSYVYNLIGFTPISLITGYRYGDKK